MSIARSLLLTASRSTWLADQFRRRRFARRAVRRFMPGEEMGDALAAAETFAASGIGTVFTELGEQVTSSAAADAVRDSYLRLLDAIQKRGLPSHVSVKLTHLGLDADADACAARVATLATRAEATRSFLWIDIEESHYVDATLDQFRRARTAHQRVGLCLQAYLRRTPSDVDALLPLEPAIRLVKGAYREPPEVAFPKKSDVDEAYFSISERLLRAAATSRAFPVFGTHDLSLLERIIAAAQASSVSSSGYEVHMLYGIRAAEQRALARRGVGVRVLISYGTHWFPWYVRRLAERPANVLFVAKSLFS